MRKYTRKKKPTSKPGKPFETEIDRSLDIAMTGKEGWYKRIPDMSDYAGRTCPKCHAPISHCACCGHQFPRLGFMPPKSMGDFDGLHAGDYWLMECKSTEWRNGFPALNLKPHQLKSLVKNTMGGGVSWLAICNRSVPSKPVLYMITIQDFMRVGLRKYTVDWGVLAKYSHVRGRIPREGKPFYDLGFMFE